MTVHFGRKMSNSRKREAKGVQYIYEIGSDIL